MELTWNCVDIDEKSIAENNASVYIEKELMRVYKNALDKLDGRDVIKTFLAVFASNTLTREHDLPDVVFHYTS